MDQAALLQTAAQLANDALVWVGFGCLVGLLAKRLCLGAIQAALSPRR